MDRQFEESQRLRDEQDRAREQRQRERQSRRGTRRPQLLHAVKLISQPYGEPSEDGATSHHRGGAVVLDLISEPLEGRLGRNGQLRGAWPG